MAATVGDYAILAAPSIGLGVFRNVLAAAKSPALPEATDIYAAAVDRGVDPAVLLAVFGHESNYGKAGIAVGRRNGFGLRYYGPDAYGGTNVKGWYGFPSWTAGAEHAAALLAGPKYGAGKTANTVRTFPKVYAPASDGNAPASYGAALARNIALWSGKSGSAVVATSATTATPTTPKPVTATPAVVTAPAPVAAPAVPTSISVVREVPSGPFLAVGVVLVLAFVIIAWGF